MNILQNNDARRMVHGVEYHAVTGTNACATKSGERCALLSVLTDCGPDARCIPGHRRDGSHVIWVKVTP